MKKSILLYIQPAFLFMLSFPVIAFSQKETYDLITYSPPVGWTKEIKENIVSYTIVNKKNGSWCQAGIVKSTTSKGSIEQDFESEWQDLVVKNYNPTAAPQATEIQEAEGWKIKAGNAPFVFNNANATAMLTTMAGYDRCVSIVVVTNSQDYLKDIETLLSSVDLVKPEIPAQTATVTVNDASIIGTWGANASDNSSFRMNNGIMNYIKRQYTINPDGSYIFISKTFDPLMNKILLGKESGRYEINGNMITIDPKKSVLEAWTKKDGADKWGKFSSSQNIALEKVTYQFTKHYFSGIDKWNLVLQADKVTARDGPFSFASTFSNAWYFAPISPNNPVIELPDGQQVTPGETKTEPVKQATNNQVAFSTTHFDDGWTSTVQQDWVDVSKGNLQVLVHYPNKSADAYNSQLLEGLKNAWNVLVAPRYSATGPIEFRPISSWQSVEFAEADLKENASGKNVHVVLFKMNYSGGNGRYLEFITPDKASFEQAFGPYHESSSGWEKMENMATYNKFAVAASDLQGKWTNKFSGAVQYVNAYTGFDAGMDTHASVENFNIGPGNVYKWDIAVASGMVGNIKFQSVKSNGKFSMKGNWQVSFSDIEGKPKTFNAYFSCIKGFRILWLDDIAFARVD